MYAVYVIVDVNTLSGTYTEERECERNKKYYMKCVKRRHLFTFEKWPRS
jgi:hypothetical protein